MIFYLIFFLMIRNSLFFAIIHPFICAPYCTHASSSSHMEDHMWVEEEKERQTADYPL